MRFLPFFLLLFLSLFSKYSADQIFSAHTGNPSLPFRFPIVIAFLENFSWDSLYDHIIGSGFLFFWSNFHGISSIDGCFVYGGIDSMAVGHVLFVGFSSCIEVFLFWHVLFVGFSSCIEILMFRYVLSWVFLPVSKYLCFGMFCLCVFLPVSKYLCFDKFCLWVFRNVKFQFDNNLLVGGI